jgi:hypothetical protein
MWFRYRPFGRGIRFFPHIIPIAFPLIFPIGFALAFWVFNTVFTLVGILLVVLLAVFIIRAFMLGSPEAAWNSMKGTGKQWQQRFTTQFQGQQPQQTPYYQPPSAAGQGQPYQPYGQGYQPGQQPYYSPAPDAYDHEQPQAHYPEQMPPMEQ